MARPFNLDALDRLANELEAEIPALKVDLDFTVHSQVQKNRGGESTSVPAILYTLDYVGRQPLVQKELVPLSVLGITLADDIRNFAEIPHGLAVHVLLEQIERWKP